MKDPIKIIHKFKNNYKRIQYKMYIYLGKILPEEIINILESFKNKDFYNTLVSLSLKNYNILKDFYGDRWYEKFFNTNHLSEQIKMIEASLSKRKELENKYGKEWYKENINKEKIIRITYSFSNYYLDNLSNKKKSKILNKKQEIDFKTFNFEKNSSINNSDELFNNSEQLFNESEQLFNESEQLFNESEQTGGDVDDVDDVEEMDVEEVEEAEKVKDDEEEEEVLEEEDLDELVEDEFNLDELNKLYVEEEYESKTVKETSKLIGEVLENKKWVKEIDEVTLKYDSSLDNLTYDGKLEDTYIKHYIYDEYIYKDDTIKTLKQKIAVTIPVSDSFGSNIKLLPETQYLWSEYRTPSGKELIMLGQKWIRRNELLKIDIQPNENLKVYEKLRNNLVYLKDSFGYKIKREDDETNIVRFYEDFMTNNEIYLIDLYSELGLNYNPDEEAKKNLFDVYIQIYFYLITYERYEQYILLLNGNTKVEKLLNYMNNIFVNIKTDIKLENEICSVIEKSKNELNKFEDNFSENYIIQSNIYVNLNNPKNITGTTSQTKYNLYRIFENFIVDEEYPFIQYQTLDGEIVNKIYTKTENLNKTEVMQKWFENSPYGISFKILSDKEKYIAINLNESGRIEYKVTWREEDKSTVDDIKSTYNYIKKLLQKINSENKKIKIILPEDDTFKYAFINSIQKFKLPEGYKINHNDLSDFCRLFFPYIALVIEPKKRLPKNLAAEEKASKYGTYLRYKRISKYDNRTKMHLRILYFLRNYEITDKQLIDEISKQFNITQEFTVQEIDFVREKYGNIIKRSSKLAKKLKALPKSKPPGIGIDIQGRERDNYKVRITGARNKEQLNEIITFIKSLIYLYFETYLLKKSKYQKLKDILKTLTKIATRRNKVIEIVDYEKEVSNVKAITAIDKKRLGFKPEKGQNQWTRSCQNSGDTKKRRPNITSNIEDLIKQGYKLNSKSGFYEKEVEMYIKNKKHVVNLRAVKLPGEESGFNFYTCDPTENQEHYYIGFLSRGNNPNDLCMPCCFKKDHLTGNNKAKKNYYLKCIGEQAADGKESTSTQLVLGEKVYILQETNKVQNGRFIYLPKYLDIFFNQVWEHDHKIKNHYLYESKSGYYFKYTVKHDKYNFLAALSSIFEMEIEQLISIIIDFLEKDKNDIYFTFLNNGDIREMFKTKENYIEYIKTSEHLEYDIIGELVSLPGVLFKHGLYFFILEKNNLVVKKLLEKDKVIERYYLNCLNYENNFMINQDRNFIIMIKEGKYYHPIYRVQKDPAVDKKIKLDKYYSINKQIEELKDYNSKSCDQSLLNKILGNYLLYCKNIINIIKSSDFKIKKQYIDNRHKCKYLLFDNQLLLPVFPSGISYDYDFDFVNNINKLLNYKEAIKELNKINKIINMEYIPKFIYYDKKEKDKIRIVSIYLENELIVPIKSEYVTEKEITKMGLISKFQPLMETIDIAIEEYNKNPVKIVDNRYIRVKQHLFKNEAYNIYRLELSLYLENNQDIKNKIINIVRNDNIDIKNKKEEVRKILFDMIYGKLAKKEKFADIQKALPDLENYNLNNIRDNCKINNTKDKCDAKPHCKWSNNSCNLLLTETLAIDFVNKVLEEIIQDNILFKEIIQEGNYYVSDIVDYSQYSNRTNQKVIKVSNFNLKKIMNELFGKDKVPTIGRKEIKKKMEEEVIEDYPELVEYGKQFIQVVVPNQDSIIRAFINCYYWIHNPLYDIEARNLGYYSDIQTSLTNRFKAKVIDYIQNSKINNDDKYVKYLKKYFNNDTDFFNSALNKFRKSHYNTNCRLELLILSLITDLRIVVYDNYYNVKYLYLSGEIEVNDKNIKTFTSDEYKTKTIYIKLDFDENNSIPKTISSIYYK